jgi:hypothetical protein
MRHEGWMAKSTPFTEWGLLFPVVRQVGSRWPNNTAMALAGLALLGKKVYETVMGTGKDRSQQQYLGGILVSDP